MNLKLNIIYLKEEETIIKIYYFFNFHKILNTFLFYGSEFESLNESILFKNIGRDISNAKFKIIASLKSTNIFLNYFNFTLNYKSKANPTCTIMLKSKQLFLWRI
jgi:hypothetical protein